MRVYAALKENLIEIFYQVAVHCIFTNFLSPSTPAPTPIPLLNPITRLPPLQI